MRRLVMQRAGEQSVTAGGQRFGIVTTQSVERKMVLRFLRAGIIPAKRTNRNPKLIPVADRMLLALAC
jgi:hypothetical protein